MSELYDPENEDVFARMKAGGDTLTTPRDINFSVVFSDERAAIDFSAQVQELGHATSLHFSEVVSSFPWDVTVVNHAIPSTGSVGQFENMLARIAKSFGGRNDGWMCERIMSEH